MQYSPFILRITSKRLQTMQPVRCTYHHWFQPFSARRRYCQLPDSGKNMKRFLQFRLGCHKLPTATGRCAGVHVARAHFVMLGLWGTKIWCLSVLNWHHYGPSMLICSMTRITPCVLFRAAGPFEGISLRHKLLKLDGQIVIAAVWHMRSALLAG